jgi:beta-phosphoglucomutase
VGVLRACLFDLGGVLVDTQRVHVEAWRRVAEELGCPFDEAMAGSLAGLSREDSLRTLLAGRRMAAPLFDAALLYKGELTERLLLEVDGSYVLPGVHLLLRSLERHGVWRAVVSSSRFAVPVLEQTGLRPLVDAVVDGRILWRPKPDPEAFQRAAAALLVPPDRCVVLDDGEAGVRAAHRGGFPVVGVGEAKLTARHWVPDLASLTVADLEAVVRGLGPRSAPSQAPRSEALADLAAGGEPPSS